ncbi:MULTISPECIES: hypothetical protein [Rhodopirellula]|nr:hypothetical protein [Rhodopirellula sp. UBA1907]|tara:strand:- start:196 stop:330 length:135 start_codon:yes stop_codon:yes gene_type:complete
MAMNQSGKVIEKVSVVRAIFLLERKGRWQFSHIALAAVLAATNW